MENTETTMMEKGLRKRLMDSLKKKKTSDFKFKKSKKKL